MPVQMIASSSFTHVSSLEVMFHWREVKESMTTFPSKYATFVPPHGRALVEDFVASKNPGGGLKGKDHHEKSSRDGSFSRAMFQAQEEERADSWPSEFRDERQVSCFEFQKTHPHPGNWIPLVDMSSMNHDIFLTKPAVVRCSSPKCSFHLSVSF